jgi:hypothetical protein
MKRLAFFALLAMVPAHRVQGDAVSGCGPGKMLVHDPATEISRCLDATDFRRLGLRGAVLKREQIQRSRRRLAEQRRRTELFERGLDQVHRRLRRARQQQTYLGRQSVAKDRIRRRVQQRRALLEPLSTERRRQQRLQSLARRAVRRELRQSLPQAETAVDQTRYLRQLREGLSVQ